MHENGKNKKIQFFKKTKKYKKIFTQNTLYYKMKLRKVERNKDGK